MAKKYSPEFREQIIKECMETNKYNVVAKKHQVPVTTVYTWIKRDKNKTKTQKVKGQKTLGKELADAKLEIKVLKELLKKTHQLWLKD
ncbi:MAG: transposase [Bacteroidetes bacterium]|nr:transposase [Bacteroidota bacterium]